MATQRLFIATLAGEAANLTANLFSIWRKGHSVRIDEFCESLGVHRAELPVVYFSEWMDRWLMGDRVPGPGAVEGRRFEATCFTRVEAYEWAGRCGTQYQEELWLANRLREAASGWDALTDRITVVVVREVLGVSTSDEEVKATMLVAPAWLSDLQDVASSSGN